MPHNISNSFGMQHIGLVLQRPLPDMQTEIHDTGWYAEEGQAVGRPGDNTRRCSHRNGRNGKKKTSDELSLVIKCTNTSRRCFASKIVAGTMT